MKPFTIEKAQTLKCPFGGGQGITMVRCQTSGCMSWEWVEFKNNPAFRPDSAEHNTPVKGTCRAIYKEEK